MGTRSSTDFVTRALFLDRDDPVAAWGELRAFQAGLIERLAPASEIRIEAPGTDLTLDVAGRTWVNSDGKRNMPSGEVFTGPHETSAEGAIRFTIPTSPRGVVVEDVTLEFREGRVVSAHAERGDAYLQADARHRRRRPLPRRARHRHQLRHRPPDRHDPLRREDRRHRAPRARPLLSGDRRHQRVLACTGT